MRSVGSRSELGGLVPGDHACCMVGATLPIEPLMRRWATEGVSAGDRVFVFGPEHQHAELELDDARIEFADPLSAFLGRVGLDPDVMLDMFRLEAVAARVGGYRALRVVANMDWLLSAMPEAEALTAFELRLDEVVAETSAIVVCAYTDAFSPAQLEGVRCVHPLELQTTSPEEPLVRVWSRGDERWAIAGEVDISNAESFAWALSGAAAASNGSLRLSLDGLRFIDGVGMRALASLARKRSELHVSLEHSSPTFRRCWELLRYDSAFPNMELTS